MGWVRTRWAPASSLPGQPLHLQLEVPRRGVQGAGDGEAGRGPDGPAGLVLAPVEPAQDADEADRVDVPDAGCPRVVADSRRVAREGQDVADAQGVGTQQLRLQGHQVAVAGRDVDERLEAQLALDGEAHGQGSHAHPGHGAVADVDEVGASVADELGRPQRALDAHGARRVDLDADDEAPLGEGRGEAGRRRCGHLDARGVRGPAWHQQHGRRAGSRRPRPPAGPDRRRRPSRRGARSSRPARRASSRSRAWRIAATCSGVVPQQPPTRRAPAARKRGTSSAK